MKHSSCYSAKIPVGYGTSKNRRGHIANDSRSSGPNNALEMFWVTESVRHLSSCEEAVKSLT